MPGEPEDTAVGLDPEVVAEEPDVVAVTMAGATQRLRAKAWMLAPLTETVRSADDSSPRTRRPAAQR